MRLLNVILISALLFFFFASAMALTNLQWMYAFLPSGAYFLIFGVKRVREVKLREAEEKLPELEWQLRTTEDTLGQENEVVESLHRRVLDKLLHIRNSYLMDRKKTAYQFLGIAVFAILFVSVHFADVTIIDLTQPEQITGLFAQDAIGADGQKDLKALPEGNRDIYGDEDVAELGDEELNLELNQQGSELNHDALKDVQLQQFNGQEGLGDIGATADASYTETIDEDHQQIVKKYFETLAQEQ